MEYVPAEVRYYSQPRAAIDGITSRLDELIDAKLTAAEYRLYLYLTRLDPRDGGSDHLLEPKEIAEHLGISRDTFFVGVSKLKELGLYDYKARVNELKHSPGRSPRKE